GGPGQRTMAAVRSRTHHRPHRSGHGLRLDRVRGVKDMLNRCPNCNATRLSRRAVERTRHVAGHAFAAKLPAQVCASCGEGYFSDDAVAAFDLAVAARLAEAGITDAEALKFMRKVTGLNGKEFAEL